MLTRPLADVAVPIEAPIPPDPPELVPGLLPAKGQLVITGETDVGKTLVALEMASALLSGQKLWGHLPTTPARKVLYILGEHYVEVLQRLWQEKAHLPAPPESLYVVSPEKFTDHFLVAHGERQGTVVEQVQSWCRGFDLVVFDPLSAFIKGADAENDNTQMRLLLDSMTLATHKVGAACLVLAHMGKPSIIDGKEVRRSNYATRGASGVEDAATNIFYMEKVEEPKDHDGGLGEVGIFRLKKRKYKGTAPDYYYMLRDPECLQHTLLPDTRRPHVEARRIMFTQYLGRYQAEHPDITYTHAIEQLARVMGVSRATAFRWIKADKA